MDTVTLGEFAEAFMHGDTTKWVNRMLLFDHVEAVQNKVTAWMELIEEQLEGKVRMRAHTSLIPLTPFGKIENLGMRFDSCNSGIQC